MAGGFLLSSLSVSRAVKRRTAGVFSTFLFLALLSGFASLDGAAEAKSVQHIGRRDYDVVVAGGGFGGIAAAIQAARLGASVLVVEPSDWIGGQATAAGVSTMDDLSRLRSGLYLELLSKVQGYYEPMGKSTGTCYWDARSVAFEPHIGQRMLYELVDDARAGGRNTLDILLSSEVAAVSMEKNTVRGVTVRNAGGTRKVACRVLIDATEYGDVLPLAHAEYRAGNSISPFVDPNAMIQDITWVAIIQKYPEGIPDHLRVLTPLPGYELARRNYESYVTPDGMDFKGVYPVTLPVNVVSHNAYRGLPDSSNYWGYDANRENWPHISKCGVNWGNDYPGKYGWEGKRGLPTGYLENPDLRSRVERDALIKTLHYIYYMQNELGENWSVADDEYHHPVLPRAAEGLPDEWLEIVRRMPAIPYVRESRRIVGNYTLTSSELLQNSLSYRDGQTSHEFPDAIAIGGYILDLHGADTDSDMEWKFDEKAASTQINRPRGPFQVPLRTLIPRDADGLLAAEKNLSMTRLAAGALRLQPICMMTGQAAGALAALSVREGVRPRDLPAVRVQRALLEAGVVLSLCKYSDVPPEHPRYNAAQIASVHGLITPIEPPHAPSYDISDLDDPVLSMAIIKGHDKGTFGIDEILTWAETVSMMEKARKASGTSLGLLPELGDKTDAFVNRGRFVKALCDTFGFSDPEAFPRAKGKGSFFASSKHPNAPAVEALSPLGILDLYKSEREFHFGRPVTRGEAAEMIMKAMTSAKLP